MTIDAIWTEVDVDFCGFDPADVEAIPNAPWWSWFDPADLSWAEEEEEEVVEGEWNDRSEDIIRGAVRSYGLSVEDMFKLLDHAEVVVKAYDHFGGYTYWWQ